jgi:hypothetical protein
MFGGCIEPQNDPRASTRNLRGVVKIPAVDMSRLQHATPPPSVIRRSMSHNQLAETPSEPHVPLRRRNSSDMMDMKRASTAVQGIHNIFFGNDEGEDSPKPPPMPLLGAANRAFIQDESSEYEVCLCECVIHSSLLLKLVQTLPIPSGWLGVR